MTPKASDLAARMAASAAGARRETEAVRADDHRTDFREVTGSPSIVRFMVKMPKPQHRFIRRFALDAESDVSTIVRTLLTRIETDPVFAEEVRTLLKDRR